MYISLAQGFSLNVMQDLILFLKEYANIGVDVATKDPDGGKQITRSEETRQKER